MISAKLREALRAEGWLTITEAAHTYNVSHAKIYRLVRANKLTHKKVSDRSSPGAIRGLLVVAAEAVKQLKEDP
jgi:excisionase family DNA binding protein